MPHKNKILIFIAVIVIFIVYKNRYVWFQKRNTDHLIKINQSTRVFPHRVNSVGKLQDIWSDGFRSFEVDSRFGDYNTSHFRAGHNEGEMGGNLEDLFSCVKYQEMQRIWLDLKNLNEKNYHKALKRLEYLDKKFNIKKKIIIESGTTLEFFQKFKKDGWHTSYYLPIGEILKLLEDENIEILKKTALKIVAQSKTQNLSAISFDSSLYPFVKEYLEPFMDKNIVYHTWWGPKLYRYNFRDKLKKNKLFLDKRVKTILVRYKSRHHL